MSHFLTKNKKYWIGLKDRGEDNWFWINDNTAVNATNEIWNTGEPNNAGNNEDCSILAIKNSVAGADDVSCLTQYFYGLCEKQIKED